MLWLNDKERSAVSEKAFCEQWLIKVEYLKYPSIKHILLMIKALLNKSLKLSTKFPNSN